MHDGLYSNRNSRSDFVRNAITHYATGVENVYAAVAFFTEANLVQELLRSKRIRLIVRLGFPTSPTALAELMELRNIEIRYFTDRSFHAKIYIFGDNVALVGSANLTRAAVWTNQEVVVTVPAGDPRFLELASLFAEYWEDAKVLTKEELDKYSANYVKFAQLQKGIEEFDKNIIEKIGNVVAKNVNRGKIKESKENIFLESYRKSYQESISAFNVVRSVYESIGKRKVPEDKIPLRLEIDSFISFVRQEHAPVDAWEKAPLISGEPQREKIRALVEEWLLTPWTHFEETIVSENYPCIKKAFTSSESIMAQNDDDLFDALTVAHSFGDRFRFYKGSTPTQKIEFFKNNDGKRIRETLAYLLFGPDESVKRLANVIFNPKYKLNEFGQANAQEILGWVGSNDLPVINGRTTKVLRYFGFNVRQL
ncbi:phospholipase D-like domain-containing protein [Oryzomonas rubra]|uniref:NgoFVII family restriction endonuclease n=1 Tax=Oryzomonas rubra TaxID=2509454 RepID=A0A5A9XQF4_9BACT|nr:phospholipase D-like domain-containing protein [Oryzomonas rubra]KAA0894259.1 NgoFVII family restriction endonuclease [Oryzomonas rubra]